MKKCLELVSQNKHLLNEDINFEELITKMNKLKVGAASLLVSNGMKVSDALKEVSINNGMVKKVSNKSIYHTAKLTKTKNNTNLNKGKKLIRHSNGQTEFIDKEVYDHLLDAGKLKKKVSEKNKKKDKKGSTNIRGGALLSRSIGDLSSSASIEGGKKDYSKVGML